MTYYEWVELFDEIKKNPRNDKYIDLLRTKKVSYKGNIETLFSNHIVEIINERLLNVINKLLTTAKTTTIDINILNIEIQEIKKEIKYLNDIISLEFIPTSKRENLKKYLSNKAISTEEAIKASFSSNNNSEIIMMIKNIDLSIGGLNEL